MAYQPNHRQPLAAIEIERTRIRLLGRSDWLGQLMACFVDGLQHSTAHEHDRIADWDDHPEARGFALLREEMEPLRCEPDGRHVVLRQRCSTGPEKRNDERQALQQPVQVVPLGADGRAIWSAAYEAVSRNVSHGGMAILQARQPWTGRLLLRRTIDSESCYSSATIRHARPLGNGVIELGCRSPGWLPLSVDGSAERREQRRHFYTGCVEVLSLPGHGIGRDFSEGGLSFISRRPVSLGTCVLSLPRKSASPSHIQAQVLRCNEIAAGFYDVGARFCRLDRLA